MPALIPQNRHPLQHRIRHEVRIAEAHLQHTPEGEYIAKVLGPTYVPWTKSQLLHELMKQEVVPVTQRVRENAIAIINEFPGNYGFSSDRKWFAMGAWCREDIADVLRDMDIEVTEENLDLVEQELNSMSLDQYLTDVGFDAIADIADEVFFEGLREPALREPFPDYQGHGTPPQNELFSEGTFKK